MRRFYTHTERALTLSSLVTRLLKNITDAQSVPSILFLFEMIHANHQQNEEHSALTARLC
jgi:hypothetical protein